MRVYTIGWFLNLLLPSWVAGITIGPFGIYVKQHHVGNIRLISHELIHWRQQREMFFIFFYLWYLVEWFTKIFKYGGQAYSNLSFEKEANFGEDNERYWIERKPYAWLLYL